MLTDPHDRREFRRLVKLADDGTVAATVDVAVGSTIPVDAVYVDVTEHVPFAADLLTIDAKLLQVRKAAFTTVESAKAAVVSAEEAAANAHAAVIGAVQDSVAKVKGLSDVANPK